MELKYLPGSGLAVTKFNIAVDRGLSKEKKAEAQAQNKQTADFINCVAFGKTAEIAANYLFKGGLVGIQGKLQTGKYQDKDDKTVYTTDILVNNLEILEWQNKQEEKQEQAPEGFQPSDNSHIPF